MTPEEIVSTYARLTALNDGIRNVSLPHPLYDDIQTMMDIIDTLMAAKHMDIIAMQVKRQELQMRTIEHRDKVVTLATAMAVRRVDSKENESMYLVPKVCLRRLEDALDVLAVAKEQI